MQCNKVVLGAAALSGVLFTYFYFCSGGMFARTWFLKRVQGLCRSSDQIKCTSSGAVWCLQPLCRALQKYSLGFVCAKRAEWCVWCSELHGGVVSLSQAHAAPSLHVNGHLLVSPVQGWSRTSAAELSNTDGSAWLWCGADHSFQLFTVECVSASSHCIFISRP